MYTVSIGGMRLRHWSKYFTVIVKTFATLRQAKSASGCVHTDIFKRGDVFFAYSVWESPADMKRFAASGRHGALMKISSELMHSTFNHNFPSDCIPSRDQAVQRWQDAEPK